MPSVDIDPYTPTTGVFERTDCGARKRSNTHPGPCSACDGTVRNIAVSRE